MPRGQTYETEDIIPIKSKLKLILPWRARVVYYDGLGVKENESSGRVPHKGSVQKLKRTLPHQAESHLPVSRV